MDPPMLTVEFPSSEFPPLPSFHFQVPDSWQAVPLPTALITFAAKSGSTFRANVQARIDRIPSGVSLDAISDRANLDLSRQFEGFSVEEAHHPVLDGLLAVVQIQGFNVSESLRIYQQQLLVLVEHGGAAFSDVVQIHATCAAQDRTTYEEAFSKAIASFRLKSDR